MNLLLFKKMNIMMPKFGLTFSKNKKLKKKVSKICSNTL